MTYDFKGKTAVVTGASRGIGEAIARTLAQGGAKVALVARSADKIAALAKEFPDDVWSSLRMPSAVPVLTVLEPANAALAALQMLAVGALGELAQDTGKIGRILAFWDICHARDLAWGFADHLRGLDEGARQVALAAQDQMTGVIGRAILAFA